MRVSLGHLLQSAGYETQLAKSASEGLAALQTHGPDVVLSDLQMPEMDGLTLQKLVREVSHVPVVLIGKSDQINAVRDLIFDFALNRANVMILGDTRTGKDTVARALHDIGSKPKAPFIPVNCATIPPERFEETVYGIHDTTGGLMAAADGGTLFVDELDSMSAETQAKFLRAIETKHINGLGVRKYDPSTCGLSVQHRRRLNSRSRMARSGRT